VSVGREIERKFLVKVDALPRAARKGGERFEQGYLSFKPSVRVRLSKPVGAGKSGAWITIKGPGTISRSEFEYAIPTADARAMLDLCVATLTKIRRRVRIGRHTWEVDELTGAHAGLWLAEIELTSAREKFDRPAWLGEEVSLDERYTNSSLARAGRAP
jgi:CYTH domain-containing protein